MHYKRIAQFSVIAWESSLQHLNILCTLFWVRRRMSTYLSLSSSSWILQCRRWSKLNDHALPIPCYLPIPYNPPPALSINLYAHCSQISEFSFQNVSLGNGVQSHKIRSFQLGKGFRVCRSHRKGHMAKGFGFRVTLERVSHGFWICR